MKRWTPLWDMLRPLYRTALTALARRRGLLIRVGGVPVLVDPAYATVSFETVEPASYAAVRSLLKPGDVFFDVGAAIGCYTMVAARCVGESGKVVAFEPDPRANVYLRRHIQWNDIGERVSVRNACCGRSPGRTTLYVSRSDVGGQASVHFQPGFEQLSVEATSLDEEYRRSGLRPHLVKVDVEGAEWDVLVGSERLLREAGPALLLSIHPPQLLSVGITENDVMTWLQSHNYVCQVLERDHEVHVLATPR